MPVSRFNHKILLFLTAAGILSFLTSLFLLQVFFGIIILLWLFEKNSSKKKAFDTIGLLFIIFFAARLLSIITSPYPDESWQALYKDALFYLGFFSMSFYFRVFKEKEVSDVMMLLCISFIAVAIIGIVRFNLGVVHRAESFGSGYSTYSTYLLAGLGIILSQNRRHFLKNQYAMSAALVLIFTGLITSLGRFNISLAVVVFIAGIFLFKINYKTIIISVLLAAGLSYVSFLNNSREAELRAKEPASLSDRDVIYEGASAIWKERPLTGFGPRTFHQVFPFTEKFRDKNIGSWHNDFLQVYMESGIIGLAAFILLLIFIFNKGIRFMLKKKPANDYIPAGILLAMGGIVLSSLTAGFINSPVLAVLFSLLAALLSAITDQKEINGF